MSFFVPVKRAQRARSAVALNEQVHDTKRTR